eukprot:TRINITY_DN12186_c0_g1_i1.p1 TRINITY_DN12186_c0_g1~~TRINITY_DN12186_c0_g1_i1.p1  ORF type:complete len:255 (+),score=134.33 TRINITY_DN12186_c0_g1_i1:2-766(+)
MYAHSFVCLSFFCCFFFFQAEDGIRYLVRSRGLGDVYKRQLFDAITFIATHSAVVLTTHHLEEVDVLAHRVGIMDRGAMKCLGSLESLKAKYGDGIEVTLQTSPEGQVEENVAKAKKFMEATFPDATISEERQQRLLYVLPFSSIKLSDLFEKIMQAVDSGNHGIQDYTVQQSSLEQVFLRISRQGEEEANGEAAAADDDNKSEAVLARSYNSHAAPPSCLLYTSDAADDLLCVDLGGRRIINKKTRSREKSYT